MSSEEAMSAEDSKPSPHAFTWRSVPSVRSVIHRPLTLRLAGVAVACAAALGASVQLPAVASASPGDLLATAARAPFAPGVNTRSLDYRTVTSTGEEVPVTGTMYSPDRPPPPGGWPVVAYAHGTSGMADQCAASATPRPAEEAALLTDIVRSGKTVVATDYVGLGSPGIHTYLSTVDEGHAVIDSVRAARAADPTVSDRWAALGGSQGGHAVLAASAQAPEYAPELHFSGVMALAPATQIELALIHGTRSATIPAGSHGPESTLELPLAGPTLMVLGGLERARPDLDVRRYLTDRGREALDAVSGSCIDEINDAIGDAPLSEILAAPLDDPEMAGALRDYLAIPARHPAPVLLVHGFRDPVVPVPATGILAAQMVAAGTVPEVRIVDADHPGVLPASHDLTLAALDRWLNASKPAL